MCRHPLRPFVQASQVPMNLKFWRYWRVCKKASSYIPTTTSTKRCEPSSWVSDSLHLWFIEDTHSNYSWYVAPHCELLRTILKPGRKSHTRMIRVETGTNCWGSKAPEKLSDAPSPTPSQLFKGSWEAKWHHFSSSNGSRLRNSLLSIMRRFLMRCCTSRDAVTKLTHILLYRK
jgi:hypothetical protein